MMLKLPYYGRSLLRKNYMGSLRSLFIQTSDTPNENAVKFLPSIDILRGPNETREYLNGREAAKTSPLAVKLFAVDGVKSVMFGGNFITIEKRPNSKDWPLLKPEIFLILTEYLTNGEPVVYYEEDGGSPGISKDVEINENDDEVVSMIKELIFTRIKPAIQDDGGDIEFVKFDEDTGTVYLRLMGACRSCDSSSVTLKNGIESMMKHYIEEVETVEQIEDEIEEDEIEEDELDDPHVLLNPLQLTPTSRLDPPSL